MDASDPEINLSQLLAEHRQLTHQLRDDPYNLLLYLERADVHAQLGYPDLAAGDAYRALLLTDEVHEPSFEYHQLALDSLRAYAPSPSAVAPETTHVVLQPATTDADAAAATNHHHQPDEPGTAVDGDEADDGDDEDEPHDDDHEPDDDDDDDAHDTHDHHETSGLTHARPAIPQYPSDDTIDHDLPTTLSRMNPIDFADPDADADYDPADRPPLRVARIAAIRSYQILAISLLLCGCLKSAYEFCARGLSAAPKDKELLQTREHIRLVAHRRLKISTAELDPAQFPDHGLVRREVYPWNDHEPDRCAADTLDTLNRELRAVAPKCVVRAVELPLLVETTNHARQGSRGSQGSSSQASQESQPEPRTTVRQLGVFAQEDIAPGELVLDEFSILTANNRLKESLCDACSAELPPLGSAHPAIPCDGCDDTMFCSEFCYQQAQELYHPAMCDKDIDTVAKDPDPRDTPDALYLLLLARCIAMAETQNVHPLDLREVKYIWGDFLPAAVNAVPLSPHAGPPPIWTLPFSFYANVSGPLHILEKLDVDIFATLATHDLWVFNTLYSKFRGTASARVSTRDGRPEVAAVHPLWCLANHDCDPNVRWEWGGHMKLTARDTRIPTTGRAPGLRAGDEVLNHYCDIDLPVRERREWAKGSLGGFCMCDRCRAEEGQLENGEASHGVGES